jgi:hypothetical protein
MNIFSYRQQGEQAVLANNLFYADTYEQNVNWEEMEVGFSPL